MNFAGLSDSVAHGFAPPECPTCHGRIRVQGSECLICLLRAGAKEELPNETAI